jgi:hypothetical protein
MEKTNGFTKSGGSPPTKPRKLSWQYEDLAFKIQLAPRQFAARNLLRFLGKVANDGGTSHYGYVSLMANCDVRSRSAMATAVKYLLTVGIAEIKQPILTRTKGGIGNDTSHYKLHLGAMQKLVEHQGIFDPETGKLIRHPKWERPDGVPVTGIPVSGTPTQEGVPVNEGTGVPVSGDTGVPVNEQGCTCEPYSNPQGTPIENPNRNPLSKAGADIEDCSLVSQRDETATEPETTEPNADGSPDASSNGAPKVFTRKRWCPVCNEMSKLGDVDGFECPHCGSENEWLTAPKSDADGIRLITQILDTSSVDDRRWQYLHASVSQRRWIAMTKHADELATVLRESAQ